jgi:protein phosphatase
MPQVGSLSIAYLTDSGQVRERNEDAYLSVSSAEGRAQQRGYLFAVADGMGGYGGGQDASTASLQTLYEHFYASTAPTLQEAMHEAIQAANMHIRRLSMQPGQDTRMGTTLVALALHQTSALIAHVGDSRAYHLRQGVLTQLTADHSLVQEQVQAGQISMEQGRAMPNKNVLTRSIGGKNAVQADYLVVNDLAPHDVFLLCSDGLTNQVLDQEIASIVMQMRPEVAAQALVRLANERGGPDNITALLVRIDKLPIQHATARTPRFPLLSLHSGTTASLSARRSEVWLFLSAGVLLVLLVLLGVAFWLGWIPPIW